MLPDRVLQGRCLRVHALAKRQGVRRFYGDFQGGYHTRGEEAEEQGAGGDEAFAAASTRIQCSGLLCLPLIVPCLF